MKQHFFGYYEMTDEQFHSLWDNCVFMVDTNVLLDMYRLTPSARDTLFNILEQLRERLWIPYQVAVEYHKNISAVILEQIDYCKEISSLSAQLVTKILNGCASNRRYPYLSTTLQERIKDVASDIENEIECEKKDLQEYISSNSIKNRVAQLLEGRLLEKMDEDKLNKIYNDGKKRYESKIPPGYGDVKNKKGNDIYGDLVIWEEMMAFAIAKQKDIIFITNDTNKDDWFILEANKVRGPRAELRMEFYQRTNRIYYAYSSSAFLQYVGDYIGTPKVSEAIIDEVASMIIDKLESNSEIGDDYNANYHFATGDIGQIEDTSSNESI